MASLAQVSDVRSSQSDTGTHPLARLWSGVDDAALLTHLTRASRRAEQMAKGLRLIPFTAVETVALYADGCSPNCATIGWVSNFPVLHPDLWVGSLTSVALLDPTTVPATSTPLTSATAFDALTGTLRLSRSTVPTAARATVTYSGGYPSGSVPEDLIEATIQLAGYSWLVNTDSRNGQADAGDLFRDAQDALMHWADARPATIA